MKIIDLLSPNELDLLNKLIQEYKSGDEFEVSLFSLLSSNYFYLLI